MKKFTFLTTMILCSFLFNINAQQYIKINASFNSEALNEVKNIDIYLPPDYYVNPDQEYATIYYLHGGNGNQNSGTTDAMYYYDLHAQDTTITSPPAIFVCPDGSCQPYAGSMYLNSELYGNYEDYILQDVIGFVESNFRALPDKNFRMITGISMGGFGSASLSSKYPEQFRACVPQSGAFSMTDTILNNIRTRCFQEQGTYDLEYTSGYYTKLIFTWCGGYSPNMDIEPYHIEIPFDTLGNWQDTVLSKWYQHMVIRRVKDLPDENELAWYLICGTQDDLAFFPSYQEFTDSLDFYGIGYDYNYFEGGHVWDPESWIIAVHWIDSIINLEYQTVGVEIIEQPINYISVYPNPASDELTVNYQLEKSAVVNIYLIDLQGKQHMVLNKETNATGIQTESLNISHLPPGVYFLRLQAGNEVVTKKVVKL